MGEMATRSIQTLTDRLREICNELICVKKKDQYSLTFAVEGDCVWGWRLKVYMERGIQSLLNVRCGLGGLMEGAEQGCITFQYPSSCQKSYPK